MEKIELKADEEYIIKLKGAEVGVVYTELSKLPYAQVSTLMMSLENQCKEQLKK